jgi:hypothetical protein
MRQIPNCAVIWCAAVLQAGCQAAVRQEDGRLCGAGSDPTWTVLRSPPAAAPSLRSFADARPNFLVGLQRYTLELWLSQDPNHIILCRSDEPPRHACDGEWWRFERDAGEWHVAASKAWICVT